MGKLYLVQIKSNAIEKEDKKALLIPMEIDLEGKRYSKKEIHDALIRDAIKLYPQYTNIDDNPRFTISVMSRKEYKEWVDTNIVKQKSLARGV